jgi:hypothetical protein
MKVNDENDQQIQPQVVEIPLRDATSSRTGKGKTRQRSKQDQPAEQAVRAHRRPEVLVAGRDEFTENGTTYRMLRMRNISASTSPRDLVRLFSKQDFHVADVEIYLTDAQDLTGMAILTLPGREAWYAQEWAHGRSWRGQKLDVAIKREGRWWSLA